MREISFPRDTISNGAIDLYKGRIAELIGHQDRMDEPRRTVRVSDINAVPYVGPRGGIRRYTTSMFCDDVCEDGDVEEPIIARIDAQNSTPIEEEDILFLDEDEDESGDWPLFVAGVPLDEYLATADANKLPKEPLRPMTERETELFGIVATLMGLETADVARTEGMLLALCVVLDQATAPPPTAYQPRMRATDVESCRRDPIADVWADDDLAPYEQLAMAAGAENEPSFFRRMSN